MKNEYLQQAEKFLADTVTILTVEYLRTAPYFQDDKESRDIYRFTLKNARSEYSSEFGNSINNTEARALVRALGKKAFDPRPSDSHDALKQKAAHKAALKNKSYLPPNAYDILACLEKYEVKPIFENWARELGYDDAPMCDYPKIRAIHDACLAQYAGIRRLFTAEQMEQLQEIQ